MKTFSANNGVFRTACGRTRFRTGLAGSPATTRNKKMEEMQKQIEDLKTELAKMKTEKK